MMSGFSLMNLMSSIYTVHISMPHLPRQLQEKEYPSQLLEISHPPEKLWMQGTFPSKNTKYLTIVGSRAATPYGKDALKSLVQGLSGYPVTIVSGLALGIDGEAHKVALAASLHTIAVPGSGLDPSCLYPRANISLARDILDAGGALLSEHPPMYHARAYDFPSRNRIMVGLSHAVLVIEAAQRSGTLITARLSHEYNRDLLCVPHRIGDTNGFASELFLRLGATLVASPQHILEALHIEPIKKDSSVQVHALSSPERAVYDALHTPQKRDEIIRAVKLPGAETLSALVSLELRGIIVEEFGAWHKV